MTKEGGRFRNFYICDASNSPYGAVIFYAALLSTWLPSTTTAFPFCFAASAALEESFRRLLIRGVPAPGVEVPLTSPALPGCAKPDGGRLFARDGEGADCAAALLAAVWSAGGAGRLTF